jgi:hypothetical protein
MSYPHGLPRRYRKHWAHPWTSRAKRSPGFRSWLARHGYLSPHFTLREAACHDGTPVPRMLRPGARNHAFNLEKLRHALGGVRMPVLSWYRTPAYNRKIGGATRSQHMTARATDFSKAWVDDIGHARVFNTANIIFSNGGVGEYPGGSAHFDSRGWRARWTSW